MAQSSGGAGSGTAGPDPHGQSGAASPHPPTEASPPHPAAEAAWPYLPTETGGYGPEAPAAPFRGHAGPATGQTVSAAGPADIVRQGPGVPGASSASLSESAAEQVWRTGQMPAPHRRRRRVRRIASGALTVTLLAAAVVVLYLRFHHAPLRVTGVTITRQAANGCAVDVTGRITTNGSAGTVSYQWLLEPQSQAPQPVSQSVVAGQDAVYVTVAVQGQGQGSAARDVTLQVLGPGTGTASVHVTVSC